MSISYFFKRSYICYNVIRTDLIYLRKYAMAKVKVNSVKAHIAKPKVKRPGIHAKTKVSASKNATNYAKPYASQGR